MTTIVTIGIDMAKNVFATHGVDATGKPVLLRPRVPRATLLELISLAWKRALVPITGLANSRGSAKTCA